MYGVRSEWFHAIGSYNEVNEVAEVVALSFDKGSETRYHLSRQPRRIKILNISVNDTYSLIQ